MRILSLAALMAALLLLAMPTAWAEEGDSDLVEIDESEIIIIEEDTTLPTVDQLPTADPVRSIVVVPATPAPYVRPCVTPCATPCAPPCPPRRQWIPARREARCRTVTVPARTFSRYVPVYKDVEIPLYKYQCEPIMRTASYPDWAQRCVPVMKTTMVRVYKTREMPITRTQRIPITKTVCDPCTGQQKVVNCGFRTETVPCGSRTVKYFAGWRKEAEQCGTRLEWYRCGTLTKPVQCGSKSVRTQIGCRTEKRFKCWRQETMVLQPEKQVQRTDYVVIPGRWATTTPPPLNPCR